MALGSFTHGALAELTVADLERMLTLDETLFVEHKRSIGAEPDESFNLAKAVASFANTAGGWLLLGVHGGTPVGGREDWNSTGTALALVDVIRDRLRGQIDPLPAFEARVLDHAAGQVGVVRVYESSDAPHVTLRNGAVWVREVAGDSDAKAPKKAGAGAHAERAYRAAVVRSRAQLVELSERGRRAAMRVDQLTSPEVQLPLIADGLRLRFVRSSSGLVPEPVGGGCVFVRFTPYTLPPRFRGWATTAGASAAVLGAAEKLVSMAGLNHEWVRPHPAGMSFSSGSAWKSGHTDGGGQPLPGQARLVVDSAGVVASCAELGAPRDPRLRPVLGINELASLRILPVIVAATDVLAKAESLGRSRCQIDLVDLPKALRLEHQGAAHASEWVPTTADVALPADEADLRHVAQLAANAYARGAGQLAWDPPTGT